MNDQSEQWTSVLGALFGVSLTEKEAKTWFLEMRRNVENWKYMPELDGDDPYTGQKATEINSEIISALRWMSYRGIDPPRADGNRKTARYTCSDVMLWVYVWKKNQSQFGGSTDNTRFDKMFIEALKPVLSQLVHDKRYDDASFAIPMPHNCSEAITALFNCGLGNVGPTETAEQALNTFCIVELGFDPESQRADWYKRNIDRIRGKEEKIGDVSC